MKEETSTNSLVFARKLKKLFPTTKAQTFFLKILFFIDRCSFPIVRFSLEDRSKLSSFFFVEKILMSAIKRWIRAKIKMRHFSEFFHRSFPKREKQNLEKPSILDRRKTFRPIFLWLFVTLKNRRIFPKLVLKRWDNVDFSQLIVRFEDF